MEKKPRIRLSKSARKRRGPVTIVTTDAIVRVAGPEDEAGFMKLAKMMHNENGLFELNEQKVAEMVRPALRRENGIVGVIGPKDNLEAFIFLRACSTWYSDEIYLEELSVFVHPDYRSAKDSRVRKLITFAKEVAEGLGVPLLIGILSNQRTPAKVAFYERQFGDSAGAFFVWGRKTGFAQEHDTTKH